MCLFHFTFYLFYFVLVIQKRHKADREVNHRQVETLRDGEWKWIKWKHVLVGDIVKVHNNNFFPADLVVLSTRYVTCIKMLMNEVKLLQIIMKVE